MHVQKRFEKIANKNPHYSSYIAFAETVRDSTLSESTVRRWFYKLIDVDDYGKSDGPAILRYLVSLTKGGSQKEAI